MKKSTHYTAVIGIFKESFSNFPLNKLRRLSKDDHLIYEARVAVKELIEEKENNYSA
ncbi:MAG TPA: hypothetical protein VNB90_13845 [Cytophagaceae bacterium]|nr:hypothetical protein [Cytophagaceae bacterium]